MKRVNWKAEAYICVTALAGLFLLRSAFLGWHSDNPVKFVAYCIIAALSSRLKVRLPGVTGTLSVNFVFILLGVLELSFSETLVLGMTAGLLQVLWKAAKRPTVRQVAFNMGNLALSIATAYGTFHYLMQSAGGPALGRPVLLALAASALFLTNTLPVSLIIALTEGKSVQKIWHECYFWSFPCYLAGGAAAYLFHEINVWINWQTTLLVLPAVYWIYHSYRLYLGRLEAEKTHAEDMSSLHLRTIEALALAIDAKDHTTHDHLRRVQVYALEIGKDLGLTDEDLEALRAASLLHDIGKLAVPEHIISKPGRLTPEEFERMKVHPVVGAEILQRVEFPYPVVPIVRAHHEKWDGTGYPDGLKGEEIPIGARILTAVDCLDALASDRQYRRALPLDEAMECVVAEAGKSFDPQVVALLHKRYQELERQAQGQQVERIKLSHAVKVERGVAPDAGFEGADHAIMAVGNTAKPDFVDSIAAARMEVQTLFDLSKDLVSSLRLDETMSFFDIRLRRIIPYDALALYVLREGKLIAEYVNGENSRLFSSLEIPLGDGLSGWVARNAMPIVNGNPSVEPGYLNDPKVFSTLRSALAVPLESAKDQIIGVLALYHNESDAFNKDQLRVLQAISHKLAMSVENALKFRQAEKSATIDGLTGLPNARSLFLHLDAELSRAKRDESTLALLVCDLDGFKQVNDRFGHLEGNRVLQMVAEGLRESIRSYDYVARMGGDEFVLVLPGQKPDGLDTRIRKMCDMVREVGRTVCGEDVLALSVGSACYPPDGSDAEQLLAEADRHMYQVKQQHRKLWVIRPSREKDSDIRPITLQ